MGTSPYIGSIKTFAFSFNPRGYAMCNGQLLAIQQNTALFSLLGTTYGGNGQTNFALPDLRSRVGVHVGQGPGLSQYVLGQQGGVENVTLLQSQMPQHTHTFAGTGSLNAVQTKATVPGPAAGSLFARGADQNGTDTPQIYVPSGTAGTQVALGGVNVAGTIGIAGGSVPFSILQPYLALNFCIALQGLFPTRN